MDLTDENPLKRDRFYAPIKDATEAVLRSTDVLRPIDVLIQLEVITPELVEEWRKGEVPYLERGITAGLSRVARMLTILHAHALELGLVPIAGKYTRRGSKARLRFSKSGERASEEAYSRHYQKRAALK
jgi:hypothetical protein